MLVVLVLLAYIVVVLLTNGAALVPLWQLAVWCWSVNPPVVTALVVAWLCGCAAALCGGRPWAARLSVRVTDAVRDWATTRSDRPGAELLAFPLPPLPHLDDNERAA